MVAQICEYTKNHGIAQCKQMHFLRYELCLNNMGVFFYGDWGKKANNISLEAFANIVPFSN